MTKVRFLKLPGERGRPGRPQAYLACGGGCCCCCCCLHSVGAVLGALTAAVAEPVPAPSPAPAAPAPAAPAPAAPAASQELAASVRRVLGAFAVYRAAEALRLQGRLARAGFERVAAAARGQAEAEWRALYPGCRPGALKWVLSRIKMMARSAVLPEASLAHFRRVLKDRAAPLAPAETPRGELSHLWRLHVLYQEVQAAVEAGVAPAQGLSAVRAHLFEQALRVARDLGGYRGDLEGGRFQGAVLDEAQALLGRLDLGGGTLDAAAEAALRGQLGGGGAAPAAVEGSCKVCGDPLRAYVVVHCAACATPHHQACFEYNGRCATFACGCTVTRAPADVAADVPLRFDLGEGHGRERDAWPASRAMGLFWFSATMLGVLSLRWGPSMTLMFLPLILCAAVFAAMFLLLFTPAGGRGAAAGYLGNVLVRVVGGAVIGGLVMVGLPALVSLITGLF